MPAYRYYSDTPLKKGEKIQLEGTEFQHLGKVMRGKRGDVIELVNGQGVLAEAKIVEMGKRAAALSVEKAVKEEAPTRSLTLAQAIPKLNRLETILEKGTELGVTEFQLFPGTLSEKSVFTKNQFERLRNITIAAMKQSGRVYLPEIKLMPPLKKWEKPACNAYFGDLSEDAPRFIEAERSGSMALFIGPESGFTKDEEKTLRGLGAKGVKLHENVLRTDTAAIVALAIATC